MKTITDIYYSNVQEASRSLDVYLPDADEFPVMIYFHGGGLEHGNKHEIDETYNNLANKGIAVVAANYRMYPDAKYPDFLEDCAEVVAWTFKNMKNYGKCEKVYICGTSAGGYISMMLCFDKKYLAAHGIAPTDIAGYIHNSGQPTVHFNILRERGIDSKRVIVDESSPLYHIGTSEELAPMLFLVADNDMEARYEQLVLTLKTLEHFGYDADKIELKVMHGTHCNYIYPKSEDAESLEKEILRFMDKF